MIRKLPIIGSEAKIDDIFHAFRSSGDKQALADFRNMLSVISGGRSIYTVNSGIAAFYITLKALSKLSGAKEVILPAYTAGSLVVAVRKAGLVPVLCDISPKNFNMDLDAAVRSVSDRTLAVVAVHMFGMVIKGIDGLRSALPDKVYLVEDCCQAMGSIISGSPVGKYGDVSFFSFNRGKNLPLCAGGFISTEDHSIAKSIEPETADLEAKSAAGELAELFKVLAVTAATNPFIYGAGYGLVSRFKESTPPRDFTVGQMSDFQSALGIRLLKRLEEFSAKRYNNGTYLIDRLKGEDGLICPEIAASSRPAFSRMPIVFRDLEKRSLAEHQMASKGIETSRMYLRPLHYMFDLGYDRAAFPNANYVAERLLTLPVHPGVRKRDLDRMVDAIKKALK